MFDLALSYKTGMLVHLFIFGGVAIAYLIWIMQAVFINFVKDKKPGDKGYVMRWIWVRPHLSRPDNLDMVMNGIFVIPVVAFVAAVVWPAIWPITIFLGILFGARHFYRFKSKVNKALNIEE